jgi:hypothetical protein
VPTANTKPQKRSSSLIAEIPSVPSSHERIASGSHCTILSGPGAKHPYGARWTASPAQPASASGKIAGFYV